MESSKIKRASDKRTYTFVISNGVESLICSRSKNREGSYDYQFTGMKVTDVYLRVEDPATIMARVEDFVMEELNYPAELTVMHNNCLSSEEFDKVIGSVSSADEWVTLPTEDILLLIVSCMIETAKRIELGKTSVYIGKERSGMIRKGHVWKDKFRF